MAITEWAQEDRPREKLLAKGAAALSDAELLAIFLRTGIRGKTAVDLARDMLDCAGGLRPLLDQSQEAFCAHKGMGVAKYVQLQAVLEMSSRHLEEKLRRGDAFDSPQVARRYLQTRLREYPYEVFAGLFLDSRHRLIVFEELFRGTIDQSSVHPREVVRRALQHNAAAVIFAHNHPSGVAEPSGADERVTVRLRQALELIDVRLLDHFVVGDEVVSMSERGMI
ncbi:MAG: RadC family protein [bacterium]